MEEAYKDLREGRVPIVVAPTGYGKTRASPEIYQRAKSDWIAAGLVHVVPLRSLVRKIYEEAFKPHNGAYQMHDPTPDPNKSPFLLRPLVVTTLDSFVYNMFRLPVLEALKIREGYSYGHYYPVYTSVLSSVVVFDEAHLYLSDSDRGQGFIIETIQALLDFLAKTGANVLVETASMRPTTLMSIATLIAESGREVSIRILSCPKTSRYNDRLKDLLSTARRRVKRRARINTSPDDQWLKEASTINWKTRIYKDWNSIIKEAKKLSNYGRVLIVANTVPRAIAIYRRLKGESAILIHGRLSTRDRRRAEDLLSNDWEGIVVSTQVIEAGVDVNAIAVFTEAAPIEHLIQRAGRACRRGKALEYCRNGEALIGVVYGGDPGSSIYPEGELNAAINAIRSTLARGVEIDWRSPCPQEDKGFKPFTELIADIDVKTVQEAHHKLSSQGSTGKQTMQALLSYFLEGDGVPDFIDELQNLRGWCGLVRNTIMMPIEVGEDDYVVTSLEWALAHARQTLERDPSSNAPILVGIPLSGEGTRVEGPATTTAQYFEKLREWGRTPENSCYRLLKSLADDEREISRRSGKSVAIFRWALKARKGSYKEGLGFKVDITDIEV